jgi:hypothetical protein
MALAVHISHRPGSVKSALRLTPNSAAPERLPADESSEPALIHRYSFTRDATDSVGGAHAVLKGRAVIREGQVRLDGTIGSFVELPPYLVRPAELGRGAITIEAWATFHSTNAAFTRLYDIGDESGTLGVKYIFYCSNTAANGGSSKVAVSELTYASENMVHLPHQLGRTNLHVVTVFNPTPGRSFLGV